MSEALTRDAETTAHAMAVMVVKAATFGKSAIKACRALAKLEEAAQRAADDCRDFSNVYPLSIGPAGGGLLGREAVKAAWIASRAAQQPTARAVDDARTARLQVAELLAEAALVERRRLSRGDL